MAHLLKNFPEPVNIPDLSSYSMSENLVLFSIAVKMQKLAVIHFSVIFTRSLPFRFIANIANVLATAFGTASSSATLPLTIEALEFKNHIDPRVTR